LKIDDWLLRCVGRGRLVAGALSPPAAAGYKLASNNGVTSGDVTYNVPAAVDGSNGVTSGDVTYNAPTHARNSQPSIFNHQSSVISPPVS
jgi:hypothetical protein